jgi:predicted MFS family arabinose efflux permease
MKVVSVLPELMRILGIDLEHASLLVTIYGIGLIIFSIPNSIF